MRRIDERDDPKSCWNKAGEWEHIFVLLSRDVAAPFAIRSWCEERIRLGKNTRDDKQIVEAYALAEEMEIERAIG